MILHKYWEIQTTIRDLTDKAPFSAITVVGEQGEGTEGRSLASFTDVVGAY